MLLIYGDGGAIYPLYDMFFRMGIITVAEAELNEPLPRPMPRAVILVGEDSNEYKILAERYSAPVLRVGTEVPNAPEALRRINLLLEERGEPTLGSYCHGGLRAGTEDGGIYLDDVSIPLTRAESMLLRALIAAAPAPLTTEELLRLAFISSCTPERGAVRTHIFSINKKSRKIIGAPLIVNTVGAGYAISDIKKPP